MNVVVYGDFNCLLCYLASQRVDLLAGTGADGIEWRAVDHGPWRSADAAGRPQRPDRAPSPRARILPTRVM